jgi:BTB/POZ domain
MTLIDLLLHACYTAAGVDFTEQGFDSVMEYLYTARVESATTGLVDLAVVHTTLQAAQYFSLNSLTHAVQQFVAQGISQQSATAAIDDS